MKRKENENENMKEKKINTEISYLPCTASSSNTATPVDPNNLFATDNIFANLNRLITISNRKL
jgi:hypothetical protein